MKMGVFRRTTARYLSITSLALFAVAGMPLLAQDPPTNQTFDQVVSGMPVIRWYDFRPGGNNSNLTALAANFDPYGIAAQTVTHSEWERYQPFNTDNFRFTASGLDLTATIPSGGGLWPGGINSGQIWSKETFQPGVTGYNYYALLVRMKISHAQGEWSQAWLYTKQPGQADGSEIDNPEFMNSQWQSQYDWTGYDHGPGAGAPIVDNRGNPWVWHPGVDFSADYHDYELIWTPDATYKYVDGQLIYAQQFKWTAPGAAQFGVGLAIGSAEIPGLTPTNYGDFPAAVSVQYIQVSATSSGFAPPPPPAPTASASFLRTDSTTQGNWGTGYGSEGYSVVGDSFNNPAYASPAATSASTYVWAGSTTDVRALQRPNASDRIAATWYSGSPFLIDTNINDTNTHQVALYCLDWDSTGRRQKIDVLDTAGNVLNSQTLTTSFNNGVYLVWNVTGHVIFRITSTAGSNGVVEGIFFGGPSKPPSPTATFVKTDASTQGNWRTAYGSEGYNVVGNSSSNPAYASPAPSGASTFVWAGSTTDVRALQKANATDHIAATWYSGSPFLIDTNINDTNTHQVALYCLDWDSTGRRQKIDVLDTAGNVLNSQTLTTSFHNGVYLVWNVTGHVTFRITSTAGSNGVVEGIFFGGQ
jgi:hypothetical protein